MTATDGNPLTGDPSSDAVRHLLALIVPGRSCADVIDRLARDLARATGEPLGAVEVRYDLGHAAGVLCAPRCLPADVRADSVHRPASQETEGGES